MADDEYGNRQYYNVTEYFRLRTNYDVMYLDVYERHANQIFDPNTHTISSSRINLGLDDDLDVIRQTCYKLHIFIAVHSHSVNTVSNHKIQQIFICHICKLLKRVIK